MKAYVFQAALLCEDCAREFMAANAKPDHVDMADESSYDSDEWPKGPYSEGGGETDCPQHCDSCGVFLENPLTPDGGDYVREKAAEFVATLDTDEELSWREIAALADEADQGSLGALIDFYLAWG